MYWIHALDLKLVDFDFTRNKHTCTKHPAIAKSAIIVILVASDLRRDSSMSQSIVYSAVIGISTALTVESPSSELSEVVLLLLLITGSRRLYGYRRA